MDAERLNERIEFAKKSVDERLDGHGNSFLAIVPGTGWKDGLKGLFEQEEEVSYADLNVPGAGLAVEGHSKSMKVGKLDGRPTLILGRVHANEECRNPDVHQAMAVVIGAIRDKLDGLIITSGVGSLHGRIGVEQGLIQSLIRTALIDVMGWAVRGRRKEHVGVGDVALIDTMTTGSLGPYSPIGAGGFIDFHHAGIHRDNDLYFNIGREAVRSIQGHCPCVVHSYIPGPQFESTVDKLAMRALGCDTIGMSNIQEMLIATQEDIPFVGLGLATNGPFGAHSHSGNQETGEKGAARTRGILTNLANNWPEK